MLELSTLTTTTTLRQRWAYANNECADGAGAEYTDYDADQRKPNDDPNCDAEQANPAHADGEHGNFAQDEHSDDNADTGVDRTDVERGTHANAEHADVHG